MEKNEIIEVNSREEDDSKSPIIKQTDETTNSIVKKDDTEQAPVIEQPNETTNSIVKKDNAEKEPVIEQPVKKKRNPFLKLLSFLLKTIITILGIAIIWILFCFLNRTNNLKALPDGYSIYVRTDSVWDAIEPLLDLKAADMIFAEPELLSFRETFMSLRQSTLRENKFVNFALSRRIDAALYTQLLDAENSEGSLNDALQSKSSKINSSFTVIIDAGVFSAITNLTPIVTNFISIPNLIYAQSGKNSHFEYRTENSTFYIKPYKNLVICTSSMELLERSLKLDNTSRYNEQTLALLSEKLEDPFRITADSKSLLSLLSSENVYLSQITSIISSESLSTVGFGISDKDIQLEAKIPFTIKEESIESPTAKILQQNSTLPPLLAKLPDSVQYYTFINAGTIENLKDVAFEILKSTKMRNVESLWAKANSACSTILGVTLEEVLFSWTGTECAAIGLENKSYPIFAIQITDEAKRKTVFDSLLSSIIVRSDNSLILDGVRLPTIQLSTFLGDLLKAFGISLPEPYYMIQNGYLWLSQSAENLATLNSSIKKGTKLTKNENWIQVSSKQNPLSSLSLYYNLERSLPFFLKNNSMFTSVLKLYNIGKADISIKDDTLSLCLHAASVESNSSQVIPGYPIQLEGNNSSSLYKSKQAKSNTVFWLEDENKICTFNTANFSQNSTKLNGTCYIEAAEENALKGAIWAVTKDGITYLYTEALELCPGFPILTGETISAPPCVSNNKLLIPTISGGICSVSTDGSFVFTSIPLLGEIKAAPTTLDGLTAVYGKGFLGEIFFLRDDMCINSETPIEIEGIAYGSPALLKNNDTVITGFITQSGLFSLWDELYNSYSDLFPIKLDGIFYLNAISADEYFYALSVEGTLYRISLDGNVLAVSIPYLQAKKGFLTAFDYDKDGKSEIFVSGDSNLLYGFNSDLELLNAFPLAGSGVPVFSDVNGDKKTDCLLLTIDKKLSAWKVR